MEFDVFGTAEDRNCLFVLGWGNRPGHAPVRWLIDHLTDDGWQVHTATLPLHVTDVHREWVAPVEEYAGGLESFALVGHSAGGLTAAHVDAPNASTRTYLSPWWGYPPATSGRLPALLARLPTDAKILPSSLDNPRLLGEHATPEQAAAVPERVSPRFLRATRQAQRTVPPIADDAVVFCSLSDRVVSTRAIGDRVPAERITLYDGGHELFSSTDRERHLHTLLSVVEHGAAAVR